jgi:hypothetical protein
MHCIVMSVATSGITPGNISTSFFSARGVEAVLQGLEYGGIWTIMGQGHRKRGIILEMENHSPGNARGVQVSRVSSAHLQRGPI